jgi:signal transduction histidine kinase
MAQDRYSYEELLADLAERQPQLAEIIRERDEFAHQLREAKSALEEQQNAQYGAYCQLVELESVRAFDDVARGIEHNLFNALTSVEGFTELLLINPERLADPAQARAYLNAIMSASKDARAIIERVREFYYNSNELVHRRSWLR